MRRKQTNFARIVQLPLPDAEAGNQGPALAAGFSVRSSKSVQYNRLVPDPHSQKREPFILSDG